MPVREFLDWLRSLDCALVIEFPDREDPMVQRLLSGKREKANPDYERETFERALGERFEVERTERLGRGRSTRHAHARERRLHLGALWALAFAQPLFDLLGDATRSSSSRAGARRADIVLFAFVVHAGAAGAADAARLARRADPARARRRRSSSCSSACSSAAFVLPPVGDLLGGSALAVPRRAAGGRRRSRRCTRAPRPCARS